jgi:hypothetical protein
VTFNPKWLKGKVVERVEMNPFSDGRGGMTHDPRIVFTDGSSIRFDVAPTENDEGGVDIRYIKPFTRRRPRIQVDLTEAQWALVARALGDGPRDGFTPAQQQALEEAEQAINSVLEKPERPEPKRRPRAGSEQPCLEGGMCTFEPDEEADNTISCTKCGRIPGQE